MRFAILLLCLPTMMLFANTQVDEHMLVVASPSDAFEQLEIKTNGESDRLPANDGADFLKQIPGFNVSRKGGSGGDLNFRGQSGSRIGIVANGQQLSGTCGGRMDPPTSYIKPSAFDEVIVIKGPQSVKYGPVGSAGTILYESQFKPFDKPQAHANTNILTASFERVDSQLATHFGNKKVQLKTQGVTSKGGDYRDGSDESFDSAFENSAATAFLGFFPSDQHQVLFDASAQTGHANFSDRKTRARKIAHDSLSLRYIYEPRQSWMEKLDIQFYENASFHIMDTFDLVHVQPQVMGMAPERHFKGGHLWMSFGDDSFWSLISGDDGFNTRQKFRSAKSLDALMAKAAKPVYDMMNLGWFVESQWKLDNNLWVAGVRLDHNATDLLGAWKANASQADSDDNGLSAFIRWVSKGWLADTYAGLGFATRFPDYWEVLKHQKSLGLAPEKTAQVDLGLALHTWIDVNLSMFYGQIFDFVLIDTLNKPMSRNIDATLWGGEFGFSADLSSFLQVVGSLAYTKGENTSDKVPLPQVSPLESRVGLEYQGKQLKVGCQCRSVAAQKRIAKGQGTIAGVDLAPSKSFNTIAVNLAYSLPYGFLLNGGVDNVFNTTYSEHINRSGAGNVLIPPDERTLQVNEPGRTVWATLALAF
jgi:iron complex outermembrane receptor protein